LLQSYAWPGNIRELRNVLERAVLLSDRPVLHRGDLRLTPRVPEAATSTRVTLRELEHRHIEQVLREEGGQVEAAARRLGIPRSSLYQKIKQHGIVSRV
ncbi:MAG: sigma-54-dependent Fis family transcriptional regulator, partial [Acidobacteria bacterium]|nr:sigma-54-dependent Fis family transcriptional regulator [Acidobacteriota bacterium]